MLSVGLGKGETPKQQIAAEVGRAVHELLKDDHIPGIGVAVVEDGRIMLAKGYGRTGNPLASKVTATTTFQVGSVTKTFTAISTLKIVQQPSLIDKRQNPGITSLQLDKPIGTYLPSGRPISLPGLGPGQKFTLPTAWANVTPRELLDMSGGLPDNLSITPWNQVIGHLIRRHQSALKFSPGTRYLYSNEGFQILGALVEKLSGETYARFVQQHIFKPLGMTHAVVLQGHERSVPGQARGFDYFNGRNPHGELPLRWYYSGISGFGAASIVLSAKDLGTYMRALSTQSKRLLSPAMFQEMWTAEPLISYDDPKDTDTPGLGWDGVEQTSRGELIYKNGAVPGYQAQISLYQTEGIDIAVAYNLTSHIFHAGNIRQSSVISAMNNAIVDGEAK